MKINIATTKETELSDDLIEKIKEKLSKMPSPEIYWDYRDHLTSEQINTVLTKEGGLNEVESDIWENNIDYSYDLEIAHLEDALGWFKTELEEELGEEPDLKELAKELRDEFLDYLSIDTNIEGLINNTGPVNCRVQLYSNYDCINSNWYVTSGGGYTYEESYFGDMLDTLNLNPVKVKKAFEDRGIKCAGKFPNKKNRDGKEYVDYVKFAIEMENNSCTGLLAIVCKIDINDVVEHGGMPTKFIIPKGNCCGIYSDFQGGGSMIECELLRDMEVDTTKQGKSKYDHLSLMPDTIDHGYTMSNVYGITDDFFGNEITIIKIDDTK